MPKHFFDCLIDSSFYPDEYGMEVPRADVAEQAQAVLLNIMHETLSGEASRCVTVTVRDERGSAVHVAQAMVSQRDIVDEADKARLGGSDPSAQAPVLPRPS